METSSTSEEKMKRWFDLDHATPWSKGHEGENTNPVYRYADSPKQWEATGRVIVNCYGDGGAIDIRIMETDSDKQHQVNITIEDGKLKARVSEQTK